MRSGRIKKAPVAAGANQKPEEAVSKDRINMHELDGKVKKILERLEILYRRKMEFIASGLPVMTLDIEINALVGALKLIEGNADG